MDEALLRQAACYGAEFVNSLIEMEQSLQRIADGVRKAAQSDPTSFTLVPPPPSEPSHGLPPA